MLYRIGTVNEIATLPSHIPLSVLEKLHFCVSTLDTAYGSPRDYLHIGGYCLVIETVSDFFSLSALIDIENQPHEWAERLDGNFLSLLYLLGDDFSIVLFMPAEIAPKSLYI